MAAKLEESLSDELMQIVMDKDPIFFEKLVVDLIERMGYGVVALLSIRETVALMA